MLVTNKCNSVVKYESAYVPYDLYVKISSEFSVFSDLQDKIFFAGQQHLFEKILSCNTLHGCLIRMLINH